MLTTHQDSFRSRATTFERGRKYMVIDARVQVAVELMRTLDE
jgi:hypothetical protein